MTQIPSDEQLRKEIRETLKANPKFKMCINCMHYGRVTGECAKFNGRRMLPHVPACAYYDAHEEALLREAVRELYSQARDCEKIEFLLAMALTSANTTTLFIEDFDRRVKTAYRKEKAKKEHRREAALLKKDSDLAEQMDGALEKITKFLEEMRDNYHELMQNFEARFQQSLDGIDAQYRHYIQSHLDKVFKKTGEYNDEANNNFNSDAGQFALLQAEFARVAHHNEQNGIDVFAYLNQMVNANSEGLRNTFCLDDKDKEFYRRQGGNA